MIGWQWLQSQGAKHPVFWVCSSGCKSLCGGNLESYTHCNIRTQFKYIHTHELRQPIVIDIELCSMLLTCHGIGQ